jgi:DNA-binding NtrC family response regulator
VLPQFRRDVPVRDADADSAAARTRSAPPAILVVDEALPVRRKLAEILSRSTVVGTLHEAATAEEALAAFTAHAPRIVLAEFVGKDADDGLELILDMLRRDPGVRIILVTAEPESSALVRQAVRMGVFAVVQKPLRHEKIRQALQELASEDGGIERLR